MFPDSTPIPPGRAFWQHAVRALLEFQRAIGNRSLTADLSALRVVVPSNAHVPALKEALAQEMQGHFIAPRIATLSAWMRMQVPQTVCLPEAQRLMSLYAELRQHAWIKKMFAARRNTDLMPLAHTLIDLCDELTCALLPSLQASPETAETRWQAALEQLPPPLRTLLSDEAQLVWTVWKTQLDRNDPMVIRFQRMTALADTASEPLVWIADAEADPFEEAFLAAYARHQPVLRLVVDWRPTNVPPVYVHSWPELFAGDAESPTHHGLPQDMCVLPNLALLPAASLEDEAVRGAQTVLAWLDEGMQSIAIVAQDRVVARRIRALLERADLLVSDESGWKLSTTRAAASLAAWFEVVLARAAPYALLDWLKSPFVLAQDAEKPTQIMAMELALRRANVAGGWHAAIGAIADLVQAREWLLLAAEHGATFMERKTLAQWHAATRAVMQAFGMDRAFAVDDAGMQVLAVIDQMADVGDDASDFSFSEWRNLIGMQLEATTFRLSGADRRVVILPMQETRLRQFDAVLVVGADAAHLPSQRADTLFFANAVRRELGLSTREQRRREQLRDLVQLFSTAGQVVVSWQAWRNGEPNPMSVWIERLQLVLRQFRHDGIRLHPAALPQATLPAQRQVRPAPCAPQLLPTELSASAFNRLLACPYQFFATKMLGLAGLQELSDLPQKRDYGDWLHDILKTYHEAVRAQQVPLEERAALLAEISARVFGKALGRHAAALGYQARWRKTMDAYLDWANRRESDGWEFHSGEEWMERTLRWDGGEVTLRGRVDRIDANRDGQYAVLDYKTKDVAALKSRLKDAEDCQLAFYGLLSDRPISQAHYVALELARGKTGDVVDDRHEESRASLEHRIVASMQAIAAGAPLPANGIEMVCQFCDARGLCRKGNWQ